jgi:hypothetical protein
MIFFNLIALGEAIVGGIVMLIVDGLGSIRGNMRGN